jgi:hypothetical protein
MQPNVWRLGILIAVLTGVLLPVLAPALGTGDFVAYWSAARLFGMGVSPYLLDPLREAQHAAQPDRFADLAAPMISWNPPWLALILLGLGGLPFPLATGLWASINLACCLAIVDSVLHLLKREQRATSEQEQLALLLIVLPFGPLLDLLAYGQVSLIVLGSLVFGFRLWRAGWPLSAGALLLLATIKPHMSYLVLAILGVWIVRERAWRVIAGGAVAALVSVAVTTALVPTWFEDYRRLLTTFPYAQLSTSTLGCVLREATGARFLQYAGLAATPFAMIWAARRPPDWLSLHRWLPFSLAFAPYGFSFDHVLLIPVVAEIAARAVVAEGSQRRPLIAGILLMNAAYVAITSSPGQKFTAFAWVPVAVGALYAASEWRRPTPPEPSTT